MGHVDIHHHMFPPAWLALAQDAIRRSTRNWAVPNEWTAEASLAAMDAAGVETAILSLGTPGMAAIPVAQRVAVARECNIFAAALKAKYPGRFGFFATLPLPDIADSLAELAVAQGLGADGVGLMTNEDGIWPGDPRLAPLFDALDASGAAVYFHPALAPQLDGIPPGVPAAVLEFPVDTARAITSLLFSGTLSRCRNIRYIFSHCGGVLPALAGRIAALGPRGAGFAAAVPEGALAALGRLHFDIAGSVNDFALEPMLRLVPPEQVLFGSDYPYLDLGGAVAALAGAAALAHARDNIAGGNARRLFPGL